MSGSRLIRTGDLEEFRSLVDQWKRSDSDMSFEEWANRREEALEHLYSRVALDDHSSDVEPQR